MGFIMGGNVSARRRPSSSISPRRSIPTTHQMNIAFLPMGKIFLMIGPERMAKEKHQIPSTKSPIDSPAFSRQAWPKFKGQRNHFGNWILELP
jgi:hypothetical protein